MKSAYYGSIPLPIRHHQDIKPYSKLLYAEITACLNDDGKCVHRNTHFKKVLKMGSTTLSNSLNELRKAGFIHIEIQTEKGSNKFIKRYITPTPINILDGVSNSSESTHASILDGVDANAPLKDVIAPTTMLGTLLYNNNNIYNNTITKNQAPITPINPKINSKQLLALKSVASNFLNKQQKRFPHLFQDKDETDLINKSVNTLYDLIKLNSINYHVICDVLDFVLGDRFWHSKVTSLHTLRKRATNGNIKFHNILTAYNTKGGIV